MLNPRTLDDTTDKADPEEHWPPGAEDLWMNKKPEVPYKAQTLEPELKQEARP